MIQNLHLSKSSNLIYHLMIWVLLISFKFVVDYSLFHKFLFLPNFLLFISAAAVFYFNYWVVLPFLVRQSKNVWLTVGILFIVLLVFVAFFPFRKPIFSPSDLYKIYINSLSLKTLPSFFIQDVLIKTGIISIIFSTLIFFLNKWQENEQKIKTLKYEQKNIELHILREQINPHFFFNSLNSIYSLSITKSPLTPKVILLLSDMMRYAINSSNSKSNSLENEILNIKKYIEIQNLRFQKYNSINSKFWGNFAVYDIEPLLLVTIVENAFRNTDFEREKLDLTCYVNSGTLFFRIQHNNGKKLRAENVYEKFGISNIESKLSTLYPENYTLSVHDEENGYSVEITLKLRPK